jgi:hypothetical protein
MMIRFKKNSSVPSESSIKLVTVRWLWLQKPDKPNSRVVHVLNYSHIALFYWLAKKLYGGYSTLLFIYI